MFQVMNVAFLTIFVAYWCAAAPYQVEGRGEPHPLAPQRLPPSSQVRSHFGPLKENERSLNVGNDSSIHFQNHCLKNLMLQWATVIIERTTRRHLDAWGMVMASGKCDIVLRSAQGEESRSRKWFMALENPNLALPGKSQNRRFYEKACQQLKTSIGCKKRS